MTISWIAPGGQFDNYTVQRQELVSVQSTLFANIKTLGGADCTIGDDDWLPKTSTTCIDISIIGERSYEYRVAAVEGDLVGEYSDWARVTPVNTSLGKWPAQPPCPGLAEIPSSTIGASSGACGTACREQTITRSKSRPTTSDTADARLKPMS